MRAPEPTTQTMEASEARQQWRTLLDEVSHKQERVVVEQGGMPVAAIVSTGDSEQRTSLRAGSEAHERELDAALASARAAFAHEPEEQLNHEVAEVIARVRHTRRTETRLPPSA